MRQPKQYTTRAEAEADTSINSVGEFLFIIALVVLSVVAFVLFGVALGGGFE